MLNSTQIKKLKRGELCGFIFAGICAVALVYFIIGFSIAQVKGLETLKLITVIASPVIMALSVAVSAYCNLTYGKKLDALTSAYIREVLVENAPLMHPERESLTFSFEFKESSLLMQTNAYKEKIVFDFSPLGKLSAVRKSSLSSQLVTVLQITFCKLFDRGGNYSSVSYTAKLGNKTKNPVHIILDGTPDKRAYKKLNSK